jgi:integrase
MAFTEALLRRLSAPAEGESRWYDTKQPGLLLRWRARAAHPRWYVFARVNGKQVQCPLGDISAWPMVSVEVAREAGKRAIARLVDGVSPADDRRTRKQERAQAEAMRIPVADVLDRHLAELTSKRRAACHRVEIARVIRAGIAAGITDFAHPDLVGKVESHVAGLGLAYSTARRYLGHFKDLAQTAADWRDLPASPLRKLKLPAQQAEAASLFSLPECFALCDDKALEHRWGIPGAILLYHGFRLGEMIWLHWDRIDIDAGIIRIAAPTDAERAQGYFVKRDKSREVPLQEECIPLLNRLPKHDDGYLFPEDFRTLHRASHLRMFHAWCKAAGVDSTNKSPHTLRHQRATTGLAANEGELRLRLAMGHAGDAMTLHYSQQAMRWKKTLGKWQGIMHWRDPEERARICAHKPSGSVDLPSQATA